ncbi:MAG: DeoR/GlpR transcriptional regulator, partial [Puniceicoccaceae bacterium]
ASGGILRPVSGTFVGPDAIRFFRKKQADLFFMTVTGLDQSNGLTDPNPLEIEVKRAMIQAAKQTVLLIDESKFGVSSLCPVVPLRRIDGLVTDCPNALDRIPELRSLALEFV